MNRPERLTKRLEEKLAAKTTRPASKPGKRVKRWKKILGEKTAAAATKTA